MRMQCFYLLIEVVMCFIPFAMSSEKCGRIVTLEEKIPDQLALKLKKLLAVAESPESPKGTKFPKISGPKPEDDVCIIGAGPAGIHMAVRLDELGYKKIRIFENTDRVGGKSYDINLEGRYRAQGSIFGGVDYLDNLLDLTKNFTAGEKHVYPRPGVCTK